MKTEIKKFTEECEKIKKKFSNKSTDSNSDSILGFFNDIKSNTELSKSFTEKEAKNLVKLSDKIISEYEGDKSELKNELNTVFEKYYNEIMFDLMNLD
jgi:hypothetical protein